MGGEIKDFPERFLIRQNNNFVLKEEYKIKKNIFRILADFNTSSYNLHLNKLIYLY